MAGEPEFTMLLLGMGLRNFSITPPAIPEIKRVVRSVSMDRCQKVARRVSSLDSPREVISYLHEELEKLDVG
jgi:phosphotransferase system enzyme I (PtsI)